MGIPSPLVSQQPPATDQANAVVAGAFVGVGFSPIACFWGPFNLLLYGNGGPNGAWVGTVALERSFDGGTTWITCGIGGTGEQAIWSTGTDVSVVAGEVEKGVLYRLHCSAYVSGTINYRMSTTGQAALSLAVATAL